MRTQLKYVIIPTTAVTVSFIREGYHYNLKHNLFARKHPFSAPILPLKTSQYSPHPILSRCMTARGDSYTFYNNIPYYIYKRKKGRRHLHRRHNESPGRQGCGQTGGSQGAEGRGAVGGEYCKKQGGCVGFSDFMFTFARCRGGSGSCQRHLQERGGTDGGGQTTLQAAGTMHQVTGTMHQVSGTMRQVAGSKNKGQKIYII